MRIGIDARLIEETGVGRYIRNLIAELAKIDQKNDYAIFLREKSFKTLVFPNSRWEKVLADIPWHSLTEQIMMPLICTRQKLDLLHVPYFNVPIFYPGKMVVTIHDLTILHFDTGKATTLPWLLYKLRRLGYHLISRIGLARAKKIIAVSQATKADIVKSCQIPPSKIEVTYEGVDSNIKYQIFPRSGISLRKTNIKYTNQKLNIGKRLISEPYFLYVGNAYPHKNLEVLLRAFRRFLQGEVKLVFVGKNDFFYRRLRESVESMGLSDKVIFFGPADDAQLTNLYSHAIALVFPSLMEGFGLPALEALALSCPVLCSDIPVFHEILGECTSYFNPQDSDHLARQLQLASRGQLPKPLPQEVNNLLKRFSWQTMAKQTLEVYHQTLC